MNDSPGRATPGSSPSEGEGSGAPGPTAGASGGRPAQPQDARPQDSQPQQPGQAPGQQPAGPRWSAEQPPPGQWTQPGAGATPQPPQQPQAPQEQPAQPQPGTGWGTYGGRQDGGQGYGQYGYGQYGYGPATGGPGGWGAGGWGQPPAAKPGVIPLRPLGLGEILDGAVATTRTHWRSVLSITLVVATFVQLVTVLAQKYAFSRFAFTTTGEPTPESAQELVDSLGSTVAVGLGSGFVQFVGGLLVTAMLTMIFSKAVLGQPSTVAGAWRDARGQLLRLAGLTLLLAFGAAALVVVLILPGIIAQSWGLGLLGGFAAIALVVWLWIKFVLASPALMLERSGVFKSLARSSKLVQGAWWRILGITLLTGLLTVIVSGIITLPTTFLGLMVEGVSKGGLGAAGYEPSWAYLIIMAVGSIVALTITMPITAGVTVLLYIDQRIRREALDLELARAAGVENYGTTYDTPHGTTPGSAG
ncbi:glycerophosphoryl diester phosphodiesterase membrane domain-containing protein [Streptomyces sp. WAC06614]|uniref:glycerophosphoryl diester phosphodiesterase membrane domain-containing protein n=1 Tax=Streptomyces sp. WAC06614 TaxID=2487416 RepID=UPI000F7AFC2C|nr:glycerophosphoryl diester phosphodiesterase membrane domain-containing protein [Streptomyces sp. WAC06614]RSS78119.1 hypothetical protein EF918_22280 [Streptomyces sp. WAC06614]